MSFILDALRKSEKERQKAQVPGIGDAPLVVHRNRVPRWTMGVIAGLIACLAVLVWAWLRQTGPDTGPAPAAANAPSQEFDLGTVTVVPASSTIPPSVSPPASAPASVPASVSASVSASVPVSSPVTASDSPPESPPISSAVSSSPPTQPEVAAAPMLTLAQYRASGGSLPELNL